MSRYAVPYGRGPLTILQPHTNHCMLPQLNKYARKLKRPLAIDLFCGAGGLSLGLEEAGFEVILGVDQNQHSVATHRAHFGGVSLDGDLSQPKVINALLSVLNGLPIALVEGGPPCQPFSRAGVSKIRSLRGSPHAHPKRELWRSFVAV